MTSKLGGRKKKTQEAKCLLEKHHKTPYALNLGWAKTPTLPISNN